MQASPMLAFDRPGGLAFPPHLSENTEHQSKDIVVEQCGCFTKDSMGNTIVHDCCAEFHTLSVNPEWSDITPAKRHGEMVTRERSIIDEEIPVQCLVIQPNYETGHDIASLETMYLSHLPASFRKHELASICIAQTVNQILVEDDVDPTMWKKVFFMGDRNVWSEPQVRAVALLMHATIQPLSLLAITEQIELQDAERFAEYYCRAVGVERINLPTFHSCGSPTRITRIDTEHIKRKAPAVSFYQSRDLTDRAVLVRQDSQTPLKTTIETIEICHGGIEHTVVIDKFGNRHGLDGRFGSNDLHQITDSTEGAKAEKHKKKNSKKSPKKKKDGAKKTKDGKKRRKHRRRRTTPKIDNNGPAVHTPSNIPTSPHSSLKYINLSPTSSVPAPLQRQQIYQPQGVAIP